MIFIATATSSSSKLERVEHIQSPLGSHQLFILGKNLVIHCNSTAKNRDVGGIPIPNKMRIRYTLAAIVSSSILLLSWCIGQIGEGV
ncbi:MAG: hypothetical protein CMJ78_03125 [Planctomycetaceae bacterium]|nr:hypothetical protein [Planctomycetaceae bacterium]